MKYQIVCSSGSSNSCQDFDTLREAIDIASIAYKTACADYDKACTDCDNASNADWKAARDNIRVAEKTMKAKLKALCQVRAKFRAELLQKGIPR